MKDSVVVGIKTMSTMVSWRVKPSKMQVEIPLRRIRKR